MSDSATAPARLPSNRRSFLAAGLGAVATVSTAIVVPVATASAEAGVAYLGKATWDLAIEKLDTAREHWLLAHNAFDHAQGAYFNARPKIPNGVAILPGEITAAFNARIAQMDEAHKRADMQVKSRLRVDELEGAERTARGAYIAALTAVMECRAPDLTAVAFKLSLAMDEAMDVDDLEPLLADLRRLGAA